MLWSTVTKATKQSLWSVAQAHAFYALSQPGWIHQIGLCTAVCLRCWAPVRDRLIAIWLGANCGRRAHLNRWFCLYKHTVRSSLMDLTVCQFDLCQCQRTRINQADRPKRSSVSSWNKVKRSPRSSVVWSNSNIQMFVDSEFSHWNSFSSSDFSGHNTFIFGIMFVLMCHIFI